MIRNTQTDRGWAMFLEGLRNNDADMIEEGMRLMARSAHTRRIA